MPWTAVLERAPVRRLQRCSVGACVPVAVAAVADTCAARRAGRGAAAAGGRGPGAGGVIGTGGGPRTWSWEVHRHGLLKLSGRGPEAGAGGRLRAMNFRCLSGGGFFFAT